MKKSKVITSSVIASIALVLCGIFFTSSTTMEQSNSNAIAEMTAELALMQAELTNLKSIDGIDEVTSAEPFIGEVTLFAGNFAPRGWAFCHGQLLPISSNSALFSILGTTYGGDGRTTFGLPDLRGRSPIGVGTGPGMSTLRWGQHGGREEIQLTMQNIPTHNHGIAPIEVMGFTLHPEETEHQFIEGSNSFITVGNEANTQAYLKTQTINYGGSQPFYNRNPFLGMNYIIAIQGTFPSRN